MTKRRKPHNYQSSNATRASFNIERDIPNDSDATAELPVVFKDSDSIQFPINVICETCDEEFLAEVTTDWDTCEIELIDYPDTQVDASPIQSFGETWEYEPTWVDIYPSDYPQSVFQTSIDELYIFLDRADAKIFTDQAVLLRMLLVQAISSLEAYLGDRLLRLVSNDPEAQQRILFSNSNPLGEKTFNLKAAFGVENFAKVQILNYLANISYHDIVKVVKIYRAGLKIDISPSESQMEKLKTGVSLRHDCVHRNGKPVGGQSVQEIDPKFVRELADVISEFVQAVEQKIEQSVQADVAT